MKIPDLIKFHGHENFKPQ